MENVQAGEKQKMLKINWLQKVIRHTLWKTVAEGMDKRGKVMPSRVCLTQYTTATISPWRAR